MWSSLLNQELDSIKSVSIDGYGAVTSTELHTEVKCRWQEKFEVVLDEKGEEKVSKAQCWIMPTHNGSTVTLNVGYIFEYDSVEHTVIAYTYHYGLSGNHEYTKAYLK